MDGLNYFKDADYGNELINEFKLYKVKSRITVYIYIYYFHLFYNYY